MLLLISTINNSNNKNQNVADENCHFEPVEKCVLEGCVYVPMGGDDPWPGCDDVPAEQQAWGCYYEYEQVCQEINEPNICAGYPSEEECYCALYNICGNGGGDGGNSEPDELPDPCEQANNLESNSEFKEKFISLKNKTNQNKEYGYVFKNDSPTTINEIELEGEENSAGIDFIPIEKLDGFIHSHYTGLLSIFSPDDIYAMAAIYVNDKMVDPSTFTVGVVTASGTQYILKIDDVAKFKTFAENLINNNTFEIFSRVYNDLYKITPQNAKEQNEKAFLQYIQQTNSGIRLFKGSDNFNDWQSKKVDGNGNIVNNPC
jgi:hypothetical protein